MWKALIKLVEKWSYRCEHNWEKEHSTSVYHSSYNSNDTSAVPLRVERTYVCTKCMASKKLV